MELKLFGKEKFFWTKHVKMKMKQYQFSEKRILQILKKPDRIEEGIVSGTIAVMQITGTKRRPTEAWIMYQIIKPKTKNQKPKIRIISAWRYPGRTPDGQRPIIPIDVLEELEN